MIGTTVGHYRIVERIGQGGMGEVYLAEDTSLRRNVALKFLPEHLLEDEVARRRLLREAESAAALEHPYICNIKEVNQTEDGQDFIVMEFVEGQTLKERLQEEGSLQVGEALRLSAEVADALEMAHGKGFVHRDLKPANIMLTPQGHAKVMDFGLAKRFSTEEELGHDLTAAISREGSTQGTPAYMSPEQVRAEEVDSRSDLFSLGIVLYEMLTGVHPFLRPSSVETMGAILHKEPEPLAKHLPDSSELLQGTVSRLLTKDLDKRTQTIGELAQLLSELSSSPKEIRLTAILRSRPGRRLALGSVVVIAALLTGLHLSRGTGDPVVSSIAVLPLANLSGDPEQEYFVDGMTHALTTSLSKISALRVTSQPAAARFKDTEMLMADIARELGVEALLTGSVWTEGDQVRIAAQLVDPSTEMNVWADSFERNLTSVMALFGDLAQAIAGEIQVRLTPEEESRFAATKAVDPEAYDAYLKGTFHWKKLTPEDFETAERYFELALEEDSTYAPAYAGLAWVWSSRSTTRVVSATEAGPKIKAAALKAIELDDGSSEAHEALALARTWTDWDWAGAEPAWERALVINPNAANAHAYYAHFLAFMGRSAEAVSHSERALQLDPYNALFHGLYAVVLCFERRWDDAIVAANAAMDIQPHMTVASNALLYAFIAKEMREEQLALHRERIAADPERVAAFELGLAADGYEGALRAIADLLSARYWEGPARGARAIALRYLEAGDYDEAVLWLERAYEDRDQTLLYIGLPVWDPLRSDSRFQDLLRRMNFPEKVIEGGLNDSG
jgi:serine/threonine-protein kinase